MFLSSDETKYDRCILKRLLNFSVRLLDFRFHLGKLCIFEIKSIAAREWAVPQPNLKKKQLKAPFSAIMLHEKICRWRVFGTLNLQMNEW
jgi:hypothetical protein